MKKQLSVLLAVILLAAVPFSANAEYREYRLTDVEPSAALLCAAYPLDAQNAIVIYDTFGGRPFRAVWYRDGLPYRKLTGSEELAGVLPVIGEGGGFSMLCGIRTYSAQDQEIHLDIHLGQWTENGLEPGPLLAGSRRGPFFHSSLIIYCEEDCCRLVLRGKEHILRGDVCDSIREGLLDVCPLGEDVFLLSQWADTDHRLLICVNHGTEQYRVSASNARLLLPDGQGGFLCPEDYPKGDYSPQKLLHYCPDGQLSRVLSLQGNRVVTEIYDSFFDESSGLMTLYGSAVAKSRNIYAVFAMTVDAGMNVIHLDVRNIDPAYGDYIPRINLAPDGAVYVFICDMNKKATLHPVLIPFSKLEKSREDYGLTLQKLEN